MGPASIAQFKVVLRNCQRAEPPGLQKGRKGIVQRKVLLEGLPSLRAPPKAQELPPALPSCQPSLWGSAGGSRLLGLLKGTWSGCSSAKNTLANNVRQNQTGRGGSALLLGRLQVLGSGPFSRFLFFPIFFVLFSLLGRMNWLGPCSQLIFYSSPASLSLVLA